MAKITVNGQDYDFSGDPEMPLLWYLRDQLKLIGTKFGCGIGSCGACTVHLNGAAVRSCVMPMSAGLGNKVETIESLAAENGSLHPVQQAWLDMNVPQCGYCQAGQIMAASDFLKKNPDPSDDDIDQGLSNLCRCGTYTRIRKAVHHAASLLKESEAES